ncbi:MAG TPA: fibronectin type III domain-containing protein, partial [Thermoanaerobaculia bacterium]
HLATADFMTKLAKLIRFGSDGVNPYDAPQLDPVHPPLNANLKVYVEFSNEIWSSGFSFPQGNWAQEQAALAGLAKPQFTARRFCDTWRIFQDVFGGTTRLVRVAAIFTAGIDSYSRPFLQEIAAYGPTLSPPVRPDVMAVTTYFGNGIQDYVHQQGFTTAAHLQLAFDEWKRRILAGDSAAGSGPDATGIGGAFSASLRTLPNETLGYTLPIVAYEGGPSLFTDTIDSGGTTDDDGVTIFIKEMNRDPRIADVYRIHLDLAKSKGLWTHTPYTDTSPWSRFGQWGHLESLDQLPASAPKYALMLEHFATFSALRHIDAPLGNVPQFTTVATLPAGIAGLFYTTDIATSGGDGVRTVTVIGAFLDPGLSVAAGPTAGTLRVRGTPVSSRKNYILARVQDADGDPAWRIFTLETFGGTGTLVQSDFSGASPALHLPWTKTFVLSPKVAWSGWSNGAGITPRSGDDALVFSVSAPAAANETLAQSIADNEFLSATITPTSASLDLREAEVRFSTRRIGFHAPLGYALFSSVGGFAEANAHYVSSEVSKDNFDDTEHVITLPSTAAFAAIDAPFELRIYAFGAQFDGHSTSLTGFKLTEKSSASPPSAPTGFSATAVSTTQVALSWNAVAGATGYEIARMANGSGESIVASTSSTAFSDNVVASTAYRYRVRAVGGAFSAPTLATTIAFANESLIRLAHLVELRNAVNAARATAGLLPQTWTADLTKIRAAHLTELRSALSDALTALGLATTFGETPTIGMKIRAAHFQELRTMLQ